MKWTRSNRSVDQAGYSTFELLMAAYLVCAIVLSSYLIYQNHLKTVAAGSDYASTSVQGHTQRKGQPKSDPAPSKYVEQTIYGHGFQVSLKFDPNAYGLIDYTPNLVSNGKAIPNTSVNQLYIIGNPLGSTNQLIITIDPTSAPLTDLRGAYASQGPVLFSTTVMGKSYTISNSNSYNDVDVDVKAANGSWYNVTIQNYIHGGARNVPINITVEQAILRSMKIS